MNNDETKELRLPPPTKPTPKQSATNRSMFPNTAMMSDAPIASNPIPSPSLVGQSDAPIASNPIQSSGLAGAHIPTAPPAAAPTGPQEATEFGQYGGQQVMQMTGDQGEPVFFGGPPVRQPVPAAAGRALAAGGLSAPAQSPAQAQVPFGGGVDTAKAVADNALLEKWYSMSPGERGKMPANVAAASGMPQPPASDGGFHVAQDSATDEWNAKMARKQEMRNIESIKNPKTRREAMRNATTRRGQDLRAEEGGENRAARANESTEKKQMELAKMLQGAGDAKRTAAFEKAKLALEKKKIGVSESKAVADLMKASQGNLKTEVWSNPTTGEPGGIIAFDSKNPQADPQFYRFDDIASALGAGGQGGAPSADQLKEGSVTMSKDGTEGWTVIDGVPTRVK